MEKNVEEFLSKSSKIVGEYHKDVFYWNTMGNFIDFEIESPIEQLLYCALKTLMEINDEADSDPTESDGKTYILGLGIWPQEKIGKYRVDFLVTKHRIKNREQDDKSVIVECDSQEWHERSESERRYEKRRDRYLQSKGYTVFHYTGKEIMEKPFQVAKEILEFVCEHEIDLME